MNLGLFDILTTQAVDKADLKRKEPNSLEPLSVVDAQKSFKSHLADELGSTSLLQGNESLNKVSAIVNISSDNLIDSNVQSPDFALNLNYIDINNLPQGLNKDDLLKILGNVQTPQIGTEEVSVTTQLAENSSKIIDGFVASEQGNLENQITDTLNSLVSLQEVGEEASQTVPVADILKNFKQAVSSASNEIAQAGLQTSPKLAEQTLQNIDQSTTPLSDAILSDAPLHLLQPQANIQQISELGILDNLAILNEGGVTEIANGVIDLAKNEAETPTLIQSDVKSAQVESLLENSNKQNDSNIKPETNPITPVKPTDFVAVENVAESAEALALSQKLQAKTDNQTTAINKAENILASTQSDLSQNGFSNKDSGSNPFNNESDLFSQTSLNKQGDFALSGDFTKFQKYMDTVSNNIKDMGTLKAVQADDVLAQIKFGLSANGTKGDSKISIQLRPKELGNVDVRIEMGHDGKTKVSIMAEKIDTLNLLQKESGSLRGMLQDALQTQSSDLSFSFHNQGDQKWKEIIQEAFGNSYSKDIDEDVANSAKIYNSNMIATQGLDIRV